MKLAVVDSQFPWLASGFRYWENYEFYNIDKTTLFFSLMKMHDYFPANVHSLNLIENYEITDIYCVFLNNTLSLLGYPSKIPGKQNCSISKFIKSNNISVHTTIYPGGGFEYGCRDQVIEGLNYLKNHPNVKTVFTNLPEVKKIIPHAIRIAGITNTSLYNYIPRNKAKKIHLLFVANPRKEKGFDYLVKAFNSLETSKYHLHIVGDWQSELRKIKHDNYTFYGTVSPNTLREIYHRSHVIINPSFQGQVNNDYFLYMMLSQGYKWPIFSKIPPFHNKFARERFPTHDGFPTTCAIDAMSTGCCLVSTNSRHDHFALKPESDYLEIEEKSADSITESINQLYDNQDNMLTLAAKGRKKIEKFFDSQKNVLLKYNAIKTRDIL